MSSFGQSMRAVAMLVTMSAGLNLSTAALSTAQAACEGERVDSTTVDFARGKMQKAASVLEQAWRKSPHPDLAYVYAYARTGDSPRDRLQRVRKLAQMMPHSRE